MKRRDLLQTAGEKTTRSVLRAAYITVAVLPMTPLSGEIARAADVAEGLARLIYIAVIVVLFLALERLLDRLQTIKRVRNYLHPQARLEGIWLQKTTIPKRPYSVSWILYDGAKQRWVYRGWAYDAGFEPRATWSCISKHYDEETAFWFFTGDGSFGEREPRNRLYKAGKGRGVVVPILKVPPATRGGGPPDIVRGFVTDTEFAGRERLFHTSLHRAAALFEAGKVPTYDDVERFEPASIRAWFTRLNLLHEMAPT